MSSEGQLSGCPRPGCKQEQSIGKLSANTESLTHQQRRLEKVCSQMQVMVHNLEKLHSADEKEQSIIVTKLCGFIQSQNVQLKDIILRYEELSNHVKRHTDDIIKVQQVTQALDAHDGYEGVTITDIQKQLIDSQNKIVELTEKKVDPLVKWRTQITTAIILIPMLLTVLINLLVFQDKIGKLFKLIYVSTMG